MFKVLAWPSMSVLVNLTILTAQGQLVFGWLGFPRALGPHTEHPFSAGGK